MLCAPSDLCPRGAGLRRKLRVILALAMLAAPMAARTGGGSGSAPANARRTPANLAGDVLIAGGAFAPAPATPTGTPGKPTPTPTPGRPGLPTPLPGPTVPSSTFPPIRTPAMAGPSPSPAPPPPDPAHGARLPTGSASQPAASAGALPAEVYNPGTGQFTKTGRMVALRSDATATLLGNGKVLIAGGCGTGGCAFGPGVERNYLSSAELYDPSTATFRATGRMASPREYAAAVLLGDGRVLVTGGGIARLGTNPLRKDLDCRGGLVGDIPADTAELYDPRTGRFAAAGRMREGREVHTATLLDDGTVLIAGGCGLSTAELYLPRSERFVATGVMTAGAAATPQPCLRTARS